MNKLERFSLHSALKVKKPFVDECFFPITTEKYVTFSSHNYDHWQEVINFIQPELSKQDITLLRIGESSGPYLNNVIDYRGKNFLQQSYIVKRSALHFGKYDHLSLVADINSIKNVVLFAGAPSSLYPIKESKLNKIIDVSFDEKTPTYQEADGLKTINKIDPILISSEILDLLDIKNDLSKYQRIYSGCYSHIPTNEIIPNFIPQPSFMQKSLLNVRADLHHDENILLQFCDGRKLNIVVNKPLSPNFLQMAAPAIEGIVVDIEEDIDKDFLLNLKNFNIKYTLNTFNKEILKDLRLKHIDEIINLSKKNTFKDLAISIKDGDNIVVSSSKKIISKDKQYPTKAHWIMDLPSNKFLNNVINSSDFWEDSDFINLYKKTQ